MEIEKNIFYRNSDNRICRDCIYIVFLAFLALPSLALAGPPEKPVFALNQIPSELKPYAVALGQRLLKPGRERILATGNISYHSDTLQRTERVRILWQYPLKIRLDQGGHPLFYDRNHPVPGVLEDPQTGKAIQMLLEDSVEGLFAMQKDRISRRYLGSGFTLEDAGVSDPAMDIVIVSYPDVFRHAQSIQKSYWFDSRTKLLGVVMYTSSTGVWTHIVITDWRDVAGEKIPFRLERWENNKLAIELSLESATISAAARDGELEGD
jgi:hypothetical protein